MPIHLYQNLTHAELANLPRDKTIVFLPTGPLEQHGPHLPYGVDAFLAEYFSVKVAERLERGAPERHLLIMPTVFAGSDTLTYAGSIEVRPWVLYNLIYDCCRQLAKDGFRTIIAVGAHGGPRHMVVLEEVSAKMRWRHRTRMISASARIIFDILKGGFIEKIAAQMEKSGDTLSPAERDGLHRDYHGGLLETSLMLKARPELVKPIYKELEPALLSDVWKLRRSSGKTVGKGLGHLGSPALARPEIGAAALEVILDDALPLLERFVSGEDVYSSFRSKFYYIPFFRTHFRMMVAFVMLAIFFGVAIWLMNSYALQIGAG